MLGREWIALTIALFVSACSATESPKVPDRRAAPNESPTDRRAVPDESPTYSSAGEVDRPPLRAIFRNGRYRLRTSQDVQREAERVASEVTGPGAAIEKVVARVATGRERGNGPWVVVAIVYDEEIARSIDFWTKVLDALGSDPRLDLRRRVVAGHETVWGVTADQQTLYVDVAPDLIVGITGMPTIRRAYIYDLAKYLLRDTR